MASHLTQPGGSGASAFIDSQEFTTAGAHTWTKPANAKLVEIYVIGAGGGGAGGSRQPSANNAGALGGSGGGYSRITLPADALAASESITVGAGGAGGAGAPAGGATAAVGANGSAGTNSEFGSWLYAAGGSGGQSGPTGGTGLASTGDVSVDRDGGANASNYGCGAGGQGGFNSLGLNGQPGGGAPVWAGGDLDGGSSGTFATDANSDAVSGSAPAANFPGRGGGGGGCGWNVDGCASGGGDGGPAGSPGGGGGAGGNSARSNTRPAGDGATGSDGSVIVITYL